MDPSPIPPRRCGCSVKASSKPWSTGRVESSTHPGRDRVNTRFSTIQSFLDCCGSWGWRSGATRARNHVDHDATVTRSHSDVAELVPAATFERRADLEGRRGVDGAPDGLRSRDLRLDRAVRTAGLLYGRTWCSCCHGSTRTAGPRLNRAPNGIRTRASALKGRRPRPLDDGGAGVLHQQGSGRRGRPTEYSDRRRSSVLHGFCTPPMLNRWLAGTEHCRDEDRVGVAGAGSAGPGPQATGGGARLGALRRGGIGGHGGDRGGGDPTTPHRRRRLSISGGGREAQMSRSPRRSRTPASSSRM